MKYCTCSGKPNQLENDITYYKVKSKNTRQRPWFTKDFSGWFHGFCLCYSSPPWILGHFHFFQVSVASSKMRRFIRRMKGGVTIRYSPPAVQASLCDLSQAVSLQLSTTFQSFLCISHAVCTPIQTSEMRSYMLLPTSAFEFCPTPAAVCCSCKLISQIQNSFEEHVRERKETIYSLCRCSYKCLFIFSFSLNAWQQFFSDILNTASSSR